MNKALKISLIVGGSLAVVGGGFILGRKLWIKRKQKKEEEERIAKQKKDLEDLQAGLGTTQTGLGVAPDCSKKDRWIPKRNVPQFDVNNPYDELKGVTLYTAQKSDDPEKGHKFGLGYANIRNSPEVNNKTGTFDYSNKIYTEYGKIGTIVGESYDNYKDPHRWFKVKFDSPQEDCSGPCGGWCAGCDDLWYGWVRADNVTFSGKDIGWSDKCQIVSYCKGDGSITKPDLKTVLKNEKTNNPKKFKQTCAKVGVDLKLSDIKKSSYDGVEVYDTSYQLGASVFPHTNWEEDYLGINGQKFECENGLTDL